MSTDNVILDEATVASSQEAVECGGALHGALKSKLFLTYLVCLSAFAVVSLVNVVFIALGLTSFVSLSPMISHWYGRILVALVYAPIVAFCTWSAVNGWRIYFGKLPVSADSVSELRRAPAVLRWYAVFNCIDLAICAFVLILKSGSNCSFAIEFMNFSGFAAVAEKLGLQATCEGITVMFLNVLVCTFAAIAVIAYGLAQVSTYKSLDDYIASLSNLADDSDMSSKYKIDKRPPVVRLGIFSVLSVVFAVLCLISGMWIAGLVSLASAAYLVGTGLFLFSAYKAVGEEQNN